VYNIPMSEEKNQKRDRRDRTEEILKTATRLFSEKGYRGTSLASIAREVGLTEPGLLHYFPNKVHLLQSVLDYREHEDEQKYGALAFAEDADIARLLELLQQLVGENQEKPALIRLFTVLVAESIRPDHPSHDHFVERYRLGRQVFGSLFKQLQDEGQIKADADPEEIGALFMAVMDGLQIQWLLDPEGVDMKSSFELFTKIMDVYLQKG
jgi:AcrR family transcriptional regulator